MGVETHNSTLITFSPLEASLEPHPYSMAAAPRSALKTLVFATFSQDVSLCYDGIKWEGV
jgi:hypothetical protein